MDALLGCAEIDKFIKYFKSDITISLDNHSSLSSVQKPHEKIKCRKYFIYQAKVSTFPHMKLGASSTRFGILDIYIVFSNMKDMSKDLNRLVYNIFDTAIYASGMPIASALFIEKKVICDDIQQISGNLLNKDFLIVLSKISLDLADYGPIVYVETFGNKKSTIISSIEFSDIEERVLETFDSRFLKYLFIDICISVFVGKDTVTFANTSFFEKIGLRPNYSPLFSNHLLNVNKSTLKQNGKFSKWGKRFYSSKINFYSTFKYHFDFDKGSHYTHSLASALMCTNIMGHRTFARKDKFKKLLNSYKACYSKQALEGNDTCPYRLELRCKMGKVPKVLDKLKTFVKQELFDYCPSKEFFYILRKNIDLFCSSIYADNMTITPDKLVTAVIIESVFKNIFLAGRAKCSIIDDVLNTDILQNLRFSSVGFPVIHDFYNQIESKIQKSLLISQKRQILLNLAKYAKGLTPFQKSSLDCMYRFYFHKSDIVDSDFLIKEMLDVYAATSTGDFDMKADVFLQNISFSSNEKKTCAYTHLKKIFIHSNLDAKSSIPKIMFSMLMQKLGTLPDEGLRLIFVYLREHDYRYLFKNQKGNSYVQLVYNSSAISAERKKDLVENIVALGQDVASIRRPEKDELGRLINALYKYRNSFTRISDILYDFSYGFYPIRNYGWIKNRINYLGMVIESRESFCEYIKLAKDWSPLEFSMPERSHYFKCNSFSADDSFLEQYYQLVQLDDSSWYENNTKNDILDASAYDVFYGAVQNSSAYRSITRQILDWSEFYFSFIKFNDLLIDSSPVVISRSLVVEYDEPFPNIMSQYTTVRFDDESRRMLFGHDDALLVEEIPSQPLPDLDIPFDCIFEDNNDFKEIGCDFDDCRYDYDNAVNDNILSLGEDFPDSNDSFDMQFFINRLFEKHRYRKFNISETRKTLFNAKKRPSLHNWNIMIKFLISGNAMSFIDENKNFCRFNMQINNRKYLDYEYIMKFLVKHLSKCPNGMTGLLIRHKLSLYLRPKPNDWTDYLDDLESDKEIASGIISSKRKVYFLN